MEPAGSPARFQVAPGWCVTSILIVGRELSIIPDPGIVFFISSLKNPNVSRIHLCISDTGFEQSLSHGSEVFGDLYQVLCMASQKQTSFPGFGKGVQLVSLNGRTGFKI